MADVVLAGYVTVETAVPGGRAWVDIPHGELVPADVPYELLAQLRSTGHIGPADTPAAAPAAPPEAEYQPGATIDKILAWVGDDLDKARTALNGERADGGKNRPKLIAKLETILAGA